jgi:Asp-tRNA(Asn)/Glu-tRNA(Gln) amidotransferase C subunit
MLHVDFLRPFSRKRCEELERIAELVPVCLEEEEENKLVNDCKKIFKEIRKQPDHNTVMFN